MPAADLNRFENELVVFSISYCSCAACSQTSVVDLIQLRFPAVTSAYGTNRMCEQRHRGLDSLRVYRDADKIKVLYGATLPSLYFVLLVLMKLTKSVAFFTTE